MATAKVLFFARLAQLTGLREVEVELGGGLTAGGVYRVLSERYPQIAGLERSLLYAVNASYVEPDAPVRPGDELALIPPVSGGAGAL
jgi:molybdopterin converting factor subunit 1